MKALLCTRLAVAATVCALGDEVVRQDQPQVFRSSVSSVAVHVLVREGANPVRGLDRRDFVLTDSGVPQEIATMTAGSVPVDVSLVIEQTGVGDAAKRAYRSRISDIGQLLTSADRLRVVCVGADIQETLPLAAPGTIPGPYTTTTGVNTSLYDAVASVLLRPAEAGRQHVVIVNALGLDTISIVSAYDLGWIARRSDAQVHVWLNGRAFAYAERGPSPPEDARQALVEIAKATGGRQIWSSLTGNPLWQIFDDVRAGYVLYYVPKGVGEPGWHPIQVRVTRTGKFEVRARPGYLN